MSKSRMIMMMMMMRHTHTHTQELNNKYKDWKFFRKLFKKKKKRGVEG